MLRPQVDKKGKLSWRQKFNKLINKIELYCKHAFSASSAVKFKELNHASVVLSFQNVGRIKQINWPLPKAVVASDDTWRWLSSASHPQVVSRVFSKRLFIAN
ncbi:Hydroxyacylglutathione hydrolase [Trichinella pseudospiralis]